MTADRSESPGILGIHHVTATVGEAQPDLDFHVEVLGLRLVKTTVNFDNAGVYHFYYGNPEAAPGSIMTTFPYAGKGVRQGQIGTGQVIRTRYAVPAGTLPWWKAWLESRGGDGVQVLEAPEERGPALALRDPSGLQYVLVERASSPGQAAASPPSPAGAAASLRVPTDCAIGRIDSVVLEVADLPASVAFARRHLGLEPQVEEPARVTLGASATPRPGGGRAVPGGAGAAPGGGGAPSFLEIRQAPPGAPEGVNGLGTVHHVALAVENAQVQLAFQERLRAAGVGVTEVRDRQYFQSIYFREPGGVLYEIATRGPGFAADEAPEALGESLRIPPWLEKDRERIERELPPITLPGTSIRIPS